MSEKENNPYLFLITKCDHCGKKIGYTKRDIVKTKNGDKITCPNCNLFVKIRMGEENE